MNKKKSLLFLTTPIVFALPMAIVSCSSNASFISEIDICAFGGLGSLTFI